VAAILRFPDAKNGDDFLVLRGKQTSSLASRAFLSARWPPLGRLLSKHAMRFVWLVFVRYPAPHPTAQILRIPLVDAHGDKLHRVDKRLNKPVIKSRALKASLDDVWAT
jgi:hypothetical protein